MEDCAILKTDNYQKKFYILYYICEILIFEMVYIKKITYTKKFPLNFCNIGNEIM